GTSPSEPDFEAVNDMEAIEYLPTRMNDRAEAAFKFLRTNAPAPFALRLAREIAEAVAAIRTDPASFIIFTTGSGSLSDEKRKRMRAGVIVAVAFYALLISGIYASYLVVHRAVAAPVESMHLIALIAPPPAPLAKAAQLKSAAAASRPSLVAPVRAE